METKKIPNATTLKAMQDTKKGKVKRFRSAKEMIKYLKMPTMETYQVELTKANVPNFLSMMNKIKAKAHKVDDLQDKYKGRIIDGDDSIDFMQFAKTWKNSKIDAKKLRSCKRDYIW